jgi:acyl carrier protein
MSDTLSTVQGILADVTEGERHAPDQRLQIDSLQGLRVLLELEKRFDLEIDETVMLDEGWLETAGRIATYIDRLLWQPVSP